MAKFKIRLKMSERSEKMIPVQNNILQGISEKGRNIPLAIKFHEYIILFYKNDDKFCCENYRRTPFFSYNMANEREDFNTENQLLIRYSQLRIYCKTIAYITIMFTTFSLT